jgi:hypothetical protein
MHSRLHSVSRQVAIVASLWLSISTFARVALSQDGVFVPTGGMASTRYIFTSTLLTNGTVLVAGGTVGASATAELYNPATGTFSPAASMNQARTAQTATLLNDGMVLIAGGNGTNGALATAELYNPATGAFTPTGSMNAARDGHTATLLNDGKVLIAGGNGGTNTLDSAELYDPTAGTFTFTGNMTTQRQGHTATLLNNGSVLLAAGYYFPAKGTLTLGSAELYDPVAATFTATGTLTITRQNHTATLLKSGDVLVSGGESANDPNTVLRSAELYDPTAGTFTVTGNMTIAHSESTATLLNNGTVLIAGGSSGNAFMNIAEIYDPTAGTFGPTGDLNSARGGDTATLLNTGMVLIAGGDDENNTPLASAELYEPAVVSPTNLAFLNQIQGTTSASQSVTVTNYQSTVISIAGISVSGTNANEFAESNSCGASLGSGANCVINVTFTPGAMGTRSAVLTITDSAIGSPQTVSLTGTGVPSAAVSPTSLTFQSQIQGTTSSSQTVILTNSQTTALSITSIAISGANAGEFEQSGNCGTSVGAGATCTLAVNFTPGGGGTRNASLVIAYSGTGSPQTVALSGVGQDFTMTPSSPTNATLSAGQSASYQIALAPVGGFSQMITMSCAGAPTASACTVSPGTVSLNGSATTNVVVSVTTMARSIAAYRPENRPVKFLPVFFAFALFASATLASLVRLSKWRESGVPVGILLCVICIGTLLSACGGGGANGNSGTPAGTYTLTITGTFSSGSTTLTQNTKLTLVVQ